MAVNVSTPNPSALLARIKAAIRDNSVETWSVDNDGDFTHTPVQWRNHLWLRPLAGNGSLAFNVIKAQGKSVTKEDYAVYHGRFIEMLLAHFDGEFFCSLCQCNADSIR